MKLQKYRTKWISLIAFAAAILMTPNAMRAQNIPYTQLTYDLTWKWGLFDKTAGEATITYYDNGGEFNGTLSGHSIPWGGRVYCVNDTLRAQMSYNNESVDYLNGWYRKPHVGQAIESDNPDTYRSMQGQGDLSADNSTMEAVAITADMLGVFYYARTINFDEMQPGQVKTIPINNDNGQPGELYIRYEGRGQNGQYGEVYNIVFNYTYQGALSSYPANCSISVDSRIPVVISANIRIGHVEMLLRQ